MDLKFYNSLGRSIQKFIPIDENKVGFYGCGPTVYNYAHIGNLRAYVFQDTLKRVLDFAGYDSTYVMNITDVGHLAGDGDDGEDKMLRSAKDRGKSVLEIADFYSRAFFYDCERLNINLPDIVCKATDHIPDMIELIKKIEANGHTYLAGGNLYYDISTFPHYGDLANINLNDLQAGARIEVDSNKKNPYDFVLWFTKSKFENHALLWDSPWGRGYPGWHIECSAMSMKYLGNKIDIHTGGIDHVRVHHTNEIAQAEGATGEKWVNYWLHNEFLVIEKGKMSKSAGDFLILDNLIQKGFDPLDYRFLLLGGHYRSQLAFSWSAMETAKSARKSLVQRIVRLLSNVSADVLDKAMELGKINFEKALSLLTTDTGRMYLHKFFDALSEDLSTPKALSVLQVAIKDASLQNDETVVFLAICDSVFSLDLLKTAVLIAKGEYDVDPEIDALVKLRTEAKKQKNYQLADKIRDELKEKGIVLEDLPDGTKWKRI